MSVYCPCAEETSAAMSADHNEVTEAPVIVNAS